MRKPFIAHAQIVRLGRILNMLYKPAELAEEIEINVDTIYRSYIPAGLPYISKGNNFWIHGPAFVEWAKQKHAERHVVRAKLQAGQGWCLKCKAVVSMPDPKIKYTNRKTQIVQSVCPICGRKVNRVMKRTGAA